MKKGNLNLGLSLKSKNEKMNRKRIFSIVFVFMFILVSFLIGAQEAKNSPVAISPGSDTEVASIWQSCPTFSWSAVVQASSYRITVFEVFDPQVIEYEDMTAMASPVIIKDISGPALSWTLSSEESLKTGSMYAWYVRAVDAYGNALGSWSGGKIFKVEQEVHFAGIEEKLAEKLMEYGVNEETINNVLTDIKSEVKEILVRGNSSNDICNNNRNRSGVLGYEGDTSTFYGHLAGYSNPSGIFNTFIGTQAGYSDTISPLIYGEFDNNIVTVNGRIGINTKTPDFTLEVVETGTKSCIVVRRTDGATNYINATSDYANFGCVTNHPLRLVVNSTWKMRLNQDGSLVMANGATCTTGGVWTDASSRALKENIENLSTDEAFDAFNKLIPVKYNYKIDKTDKHVGFIAEDVPELVATVERKGLSPMDITAVLTSVVKEQQKMIREQQKVSREYKKIIADLQERLAKIEKER
ncbi:MAG: tail fiber domain-containing protein [Candidatus Aminicenantes bacterium]|jgi:hypothetical protein